MLLELAQADSLAQLELGLGTGLDPPVVASPPAGAWCSVRAGPGGLGGRLPDRRPLVLSLRVGMRAETQGPAAASQYPSQHGTSLRPWTHGPGSWRPAPSPGSDL